MMYDVTIGIPVYNAKDYIVNTMESALSQTYPSIEFLIIDDCGEDGSISEILRIKEEHPRGAHIHVLRNDNNYGVGYCRNRIIAESQGKYLYFMDSDDIIEYNTIQLLMNAMINHQVQIAYASYDIIDTVNNEPIEVYRKPSIVIDKEDELAMYAFKYNQVFHVSVCNSLIDLTFLRHTGLKFIDAFFWEDLAFTSELVTMVSRAVFISDITYHYIRRSGSLSHYQERDQYDKGEFMNSLFVLNYLKEKCINLKGKDYLPFFCYNLEVNSFYIVLRIMKYSHQIVPAVTSSEMKAFLKHPMSISEIFFFSNKKLANLLFWLIGNMPVLILVPIMNIIRKIKHY